MVLIFILLRVLFHFFIFIFILFVNFFRFCAFLGILGGCFWFSGGVRGFRWWSGFFGCSGMFRDVPGCSGVPGSTTCQKILSCFGKKSNNFLQVGLKVTKSQIIHTAFNSF